MKNRTMISFGVAAVLLMLIFLVLFFLLPGITEAYIYKQLSALGDRHGISIEPGEIEFRPGKPAIANMYDIQLFSESHDIKVEIASMQAAISIAEVLNRGNPVISVHLSNSTVKLQSHDLNVIIPQIELHSFKGLSQPQYIRIDNASARNESLTVRGITVELDASSIGSQDSGQNIPVSGLLSFEHAEIEAAFVSQDSIVLEPVSYEFTSRISHNLNESPLEILVDSGLLTYGRISAELSFPRITEDVLELRLHLPDTELQILIDSIPAAIIGELGSMRVGGSLEWDYQLRLPFDHEERMFWRSDPRFEDFYLDHIPSELNIYKLRQAFLHHIYDPVSAMSWSVHVPVMLRPADETLRIPAPAATELLTGIGQITDGRVSSPDLRYVRMRDIAEVLPLAVVTAEDGEFFRHAGINWSAIRSAMLRNMDRGELMFGGSTISMQLVKNVFLDHSRVFSRKIQELLLVMLMEEAAAVPKERQLEIYLNIAEFGPDIFGIHTAADYYFAKDPSDLSLIESVWLASILPSPRRYHYYYEIGGVTEGWFIRMEHILNTMLLRGRITEEEYDAAVEERPQFTSMPEIDDE